MQLTINISNEQLFDKILWLLNSFKNDGLEIISNSKTNTRINQKSKKSLNRWTFQLLQEYGKIGRLVKSL